VAELLELAPLLERKPKQLSGGQRQRVAMGRAIVREPKVFLMDEPLSNLDAKLRLQIRSEIAALQQRMQTTMLYVTHDQVEAMTLGDRVAVINQGCLQQVGEPQALYERPANIFVAGFIGNPGMNVFKTELEQLENGGLAIRWGQQQLSLPFHGKQKEVLQKYVGQSLFAGLRPEMIRAPDATGVDAKISVELETVEALGHEFLLYFYADVPVVDTDRFFSGGASAVGHSMVARLPGRLAANAGEKTELGLALNQLYFFDANGQAI
jgi:multiple sugar transport system ATP-binding protein